MGWHFGWWYAFVVPVAAVVVSQLAAFATTIYLHRVLAHRSISLKPVADVACRLILWITTGMRGREWVAVHRKHHAFTDVEGDPHSPRLLGFWRVQLGNVYYYVREARNPETLARWARDIKEDRLDRWVFNRTSLGMVIGIVALTVLFGPVSGILVALFHFILYVFVISPLINGLGHWHGSQNFGNTAYNNRLLAFITAGESLHNNHHAYTSAPKFSMARGEFDPAWPVIYFLVRLRLAKLVGDPVSLRA